MTAKYTPDNITKLGPNEIFTFGSNTAGRHGKGAARQAYHNFGAVYGVGEGLMGQSYAFPTLDGNFSQRTEVELVESIRALYQCCVDNPGLTFFLTRVGCGLAGLSDTYMKELFHAPVLFLGAQGPPKNIVWPEGWGPAYENASI